ncbi:hypothetical protein BJ322DRAFT_780531 [Thelephora terrestris]|uniref:NACHT domain-containing protein n=1 Tax=Thelephora terrestris TaxID=56493 RepID=A0A9P6HHV4_9AGAM|nr:hypothetical protein BJ322DRAFT_780531 [Thelephora terrestris]
MPQFKKLKKFLQRSQHPTPQGTPPRIAVGAPSSAVDLNPDSRPGSLNDGDGSRVSSRNSDDAQRPAASSVLPHTAEPQDTVTRGVIPQLDAPMSTILIAANEREQEGEGEDPSNVTDAGSIQNPTIAERESEHQNLQKRENRGTITGRSPITLAEHVPKDDLPQVGEDAHEIVQSRNTKAAERTREDRATRSVAISKDEETTRKFNPLKAILSAINTDDNEALPIRNAIRNVLSRINALEEHFDSRPIDVEEQRRRSEVIHKFNDIEERLRVLSEEPRPRPLNDHSQGYGDIFELLENLRETVFDYQKIQQTKIRDQQCNLINPDEAAVLNGLRCARGVEYRHSNHRGCLKGTRGGVLDEIELWTEDPTKPSVYWLNGLAGTGKSTIAQTVAERVFACGQLGASFFCSRDFEDRRNIKLIFPTLAFQLARKYPDFRSHLVPLVRSDPEIAHESLYDQMDKLIVRPLNGSKISPVIIIDALDECQDEEPASAVLSILGQFVSKIPKAKFFVTGRPEPRVREGFRLPMLAEATKVFVLHEVEPSRVDNDIRLFFGHKFSDLARRRSLDDWPTKEQLDLLCERARGLFVYAVATVKSIDKPSTNPRKQLNLLLQSPESSTREGKTRLTGNTTLDLLYTSILQEAFSDVNGPDNDPMVRSVLGAMILAANPLSPSTIAKVLGLDPEDVFPLLSSVQSLLIFRDIDFPVRPFHKSFFDFLIDPDRCTNLRFHIFPPEHHLQLSIGCLNLMDRMLDRNMCRLPDGVANSDVHDLKERIEKFIDPALQYACRSWHTHLVEGPAIPLALPRFLERNLLLWLEVLSVLGAVKNAVSALKAAVGLLKESSTLDLTHDCYRFVTGYFEIISASSPHIYHSALVLCPTTSIVRKLYETHAQPFVRVVHGVPVLWDSNIAAITRPSGIFHAAWSSCNRFIATSPGSGMTVDILDSVTLQRLQSLKCAPGMENFAHCKALIFSPDSHLLTCVGSLYPNVCIVSWDLQTGGVVSAITEDDQQPGWLPVVTYSNNGKMIGVSDLYTGYFMISIYDVVSGIHMYNIEPAVHGGFYPSGRVLAVWTHGESLRVATTEPEPITIWEVRFTPRAKLTLVERLWVPNFLDTPIMIAPTPLATHRIVLRRTVEFSVWDTGDSKLLLPQTNVLTSCFCSTFSSDGRSFASLVTESEVHIWREHSTGYELQGKLESHTCYTTPLHQNRWQRHYLSIISPYSPFLWLFRDCLM